MSIMKGKHCSTSELQEQVQKRHTHVQTISSVDGDTSHFGWNTRVTNTGDSIYLFRWRRPDPNALSGDQRMHTLAAVGLRVITLRTFEVEHGIQPCVGVAVGSRNPSVRPTALEITAAIAS